MKFSRRSRDTPRYGGAMLPIIIVRSAILFVWIAANSVGAIRGWDPYPFILLNLALSAAYAAPVP